MAAVTRAGKGAPLTAEEHDRNLRMSAGWPSVAAMLASTETGFAAGSVVRAGGHSYEVTVPGAADPHLVTAGGVKLHVRPDAAGTASLLAFGAGSGADAAAALRAALEAMRDGHFDRLRIPGGTWPLEADIVVGGMRDGCTVDARGARFTLPAGSAYTRLRIGGVGEILTTTLVADLAHGDETALLASAEGLAEGDIVELSSDEPIDVTGAHPAPGGLVVTEVQAVRHVEGRKVWFDAPMIHAIDADAAVAAGGSATLRARIYRPMRGFRWIGGRFDFAGSPEGSNALEIWNACRAVVEDVEIIDPSYTSQGLCFRQCAYPKAVRVQIEKAGAVPPDGGYGAGQFGYGIMFISSCYCTAIDCDGARGHHSFEAAHGTRDVTWIACKGYSETFAFNTHPGVGRVTLNGCIAEGKLCAQLDAVFVEIIGCHFRGERLLNAPLSARTRLLKVSGTTFEITGWVEGSKAVHVGSGTADTRDAAAAVIFENVTCIGAGPAGASTVEIGSIRAGVASVHGLRLLKGAVAVIAARGSIHLDGIEIVDFSPAQVPLALRGAEGAATVAVAGGLRCTGAATAAASPYLVDLHHVTLHVGGMVSLVPGIATVFRQSRDAAAVTSAVHLRGATILGRHLSDSVTVREFRDCTVFWRVNPDDFETPLGAGSISDDPAAVRGNLYLPA